MDRDIALKIHEKLLDLNNALQHIENGAGYTEPVGALGLSPDRSIEDIPEEPEEPEEPETRNKK